MGRRAAWGTAALGALAVAVVLALSGCGSGTGKSSTAVDSGLDLAAVVQATRDAGTAKIGGSGRSGPEGKEQTTTFDGEVDFANGASQVGSSSDDPSTTQGETIAVDGYTYIRSPSLPGVASSGKPWARLRTPSFAGAAPLGLSNLEPIFGLLTRKGTQAEPTGSEAVRGVATDRYRLTMPPPDSPKQIAAMGEDTVNPSVTFDVWVDAQHRLRRIQVPGSGDFTIELYDFGAPVTIAAPPADQVGKVSVGQDLTGPWQLVGEGAGTTPWKVWIAPTKDGECFSVEVDDGASAPPGGGADHTPNGCSSRGSSMMAPDGTVTTPPTTPAGLDVQAYALPDGRALLYGTVPPGTRGVTLVIGGRRADVAVANGGFAAALGPDEVVDEIVLDLPSGPRSCPLHRDSHDYGCGGVTSVAGSSSVSSSSSSSFGSSSSSSSSSSATTVVTGATPDR